MMKSQSENDHDMSIRYENRQQYNRHNTDKERETYKDHASISPTGLTDWQMKC